MNHAPQLSRARSVCLPKVHQLLLLRLRLRRLVTAVLKSVPPADLQSIEASLVDRHKIALQPPDILPIEALLVDRHRTAGLRADLHSLVVPQAGILPIEGSRVDRHKKALQPAGILPIEGSRVGPLKTVALLVDLPKTVALPADPKAVPVRADLRTADLVVEDRRSTAPAGHQPLLHRPMVRRKPEARSSTSQRRNPSLRGESVSRSKSVTFKRRSVNPRRKRILSRSRLI